VPLFCTSCCPFSGTFSGVRRQEVEQEGLIVGDVLLPATPSPATE
jgi:hypothetical protein